MGIEPTLCWENLRSLSGVEISYGEKDMIAPVEPNREIPAKVCATGVFTEFPIFNLFCLPFGLPLLDKGKAGFFIVFSGRHAVL